MFCQQIVSVSYQGMELTKSIHYIKPNFISQINFHIKAYARQTTNQNIIHSRGGKKRMHTTAAKLTSDNGEKKKQSRYVHWKNSQLMPVQHW